LKPNVSETYFRCCSDVITKEKTVNKVEENTGVAISTLYIGSLSGLCPTCGGRTEQVVNTPASTPFPGVVSADLLTKVLQQNVRLKNTLRDVISQQGMTASSYLVRFA
jgi:hypothetical protein